MEAFRAFDWDGDERWRAYLTRIEVADPAMLQKVKAKWWKREMDPDFDVSSATGSQPGASAPPQPPLPDAEPWSTANNEPEPPPAAQRQAQAAGGGGWGAKLRAAVQQGGGTERVLFYQHAALIVLFILYLQPLNGRLSRSSYTQFLLVGFISYVMKVLMRFGAPKLRPWSAAKMWLMQAAATTELQYAIICGVFINSRPVMLACIPTFVLAVYHAFAYAATHFSNTALWQQYGRPAHAILISKQRDAQMYNAGAEIGLGFLTLFNMFTRDRNIMLAFLYWQILRTRYHTSDCSAYHREVWRTLDGYSQLIFNMAPMLRTPISYAQRWFTNVR